MRFQDIIGQGAVKERLQTMLRSGRVPHALLFAGPEGSGALPCALALAQRVLCSNPTAEGDSCGACPACVKAAKFVHPDLHAVFPIVKLSTSDDTLTYLPAWRDQVTRQPYFALADWIRQMERYKSNEGAEAEGVQEAEGGKEAQPSGKQALIARDASLLVHRQLALKPVEGERQIMILHKAELMNDATSNALLKLLEEPPLDTLFLLTSEAPGELLPTIRSRVQIIAVPPLTEDVVSNALQRRHYLEPILADRLAHMACGSWATALRLADPEPGEGDRLALFVEMARAAWLSDLVKMAAAADKMRALNREQFKDFLLYTLRLLREAFVMNLDRAPLNYLSQQEEDFLCKFALQIRLTNVGLLTGLVEETLREAEQNGNQRMLTRSLVYHFAAALKK